jgi:hypothetical protein
MQCKALQNIAQRQSYAMQAQQCHFYVLLQCQATQRTAIRSNKPKQTNVMHCHAKVCLLLTSILDELDQCYAMHCKAQQRKAKQCRTQQSMQLSNVHFGLVVSESHYTCKYKCTCKAQQSKHSSNAMQGDAIHSSAVQSNAEQGTPMLCSAGKLCSARRCNANAMQCKARHSDAMHCCTYLKF